MGDVCHALLRGTDALISGAMHFQLLNFIGK